MGPSDNLTPEQRSYCMARIRDKNTKPEIIVRKLVYALGYRYRLHVSNLPGKPDLVFRKPKKVIFVQGCFWHRHSCRFGKVKPKQNRKYWETKFSKNVARDKANIKKLKKEGWQIKEIWECQIRRSDFLIKILQRFLSP